MPQRQPSSLTPQAVQALVRDGPLFERGERLWQQGAVERATRRGLLLLGEVRGSEPLPYNVVVEAPQGAKGRWTARCTCPFFEIYGGPCKHTVALLLHWASQPDAFITEPSLDEQLAGEERGAWLALIRETLHDSPTLQRLLALEPERKRPLGRPLALAPYEEQLRYALRRYASQSDPPEHLFEGILETAAGYLRVGDAANAARLTTLLVGTLISLPERPRSLTHLLLDSLTLLEAAALDATWEPDEQSAWLRRVMGWWEESEPEVGDRLMDLILHGYRTPDSPEVERWLRGLLRKPVQGNRLSNAAWRQRVLAFLLAFYTFAEREDAFLELCWEEGEDALAAHKLIERGERAEVVRLAQQGFGTCAAHREVANALRESGAEAEAQGVAEAGLRYHDPGRGALLAWLAARALESGADERAFSLAQQAWEQGATLERYTLLCEAAERAEAWPDLRRSLHAALEHTGQMALLVEILMDEEDWHGAAALLPAAGPRRAELTEAVARGMAETFPQDALYLLFDLADLHADGRSRPAYAQAAHALLAARSLAWATNLEPLFTNRLHAFLDSHARRPALRDEIARTGLAE